MTPKRLLDDSCSDPDQPEGKRIRATPSIVDVIREAVMMKSLESLCSTLEPMLRKVVKEEIEQGVTRVTRSVVFRSPTIQIQALEDSSLQLIFSRKLSLPVFTGSKIEDEENNPLQLFLIENHGGQKVRANLPLPIKIEIVVLDGDFPQGDSEDWTSDDFERNILREREGKRPLLTGDLQVIMRDGVAPIGDIEFTDNSSWIRSRKFRLGAKVALGSSPQGRRIKEAKTESFSVRDHRGELYRKHYPPALEDDVWRLERIGKDGAFHKKLTAAGIKTVQDFLKLSVVDPHSLRNILGGMSDKMWEGTLKHARTCDIGDKLYLHRGSHFAIVLNAMCQVVGVVINGQSCSTQILNQYNRGYVENLVKAAYSNWSRLEEVNGIPNESALLTYEPVAEGAIESHRQNIIQPNPLGGPLDMVLVDTTTGDGRGGFNNWTQNLAHLPVSVGENHVYNTQDLVLR